MRRQGSVLNLRGVRAPVRRDQQPENFIRLSHLRKLRQCEQVAAVCYRQRGHSIEFLLVRTRGSGRWTFPKGHAEPGITHAQAAALEAFEEAGVHGRIEEIPFTQYFVTKGTSNSPARSFEKDLTVSAHLCEVLRLANPKEADRKRTWFSVEDARERLREGRKSGEAAALALVVDKAVERVAKSRNSEVAERRAKADLVKYNPRLGDTLNKVYFEAPVELMLDRYLRHQVGEKGRTSGPVVDVQPRKLLNCEVLPFASPRESNRNSEWAAGRKKPKALGAGPG